MSLSVVILAAGQGKRMASNLPKVLHTVGGRSMLGRVLDTAAALNADQRIVVFGHGGDQVIAANADIPNVQWCEQAEQLGTGHAVAQSFAELAEQGTALILYGDVPLVSVETLQPILSAAADDRLGLLTVKFDDPTGYGRIVRDDSGAVQSIVEQKDASAEILAINEINTGILAAPIARLRSWINRLDNKNAQREYYLTDIIGFAVADGVMVDASLASEPVEVQGINDRSQLASIERYFQLREAKKLMLSGATLRDPARVDIRGDVSVGIDVTIDVNVVFEGRVELAAGVIIGPNCIIRDSSVGIGSEILSNCVLENADVGAGVSVGPFARLRPGTLLANNAKIGNFVETKNALIGAGSKVSHLSYVGDASVGQNVNLGAGTITCNYDGANKHQTVIEDDVFVGSNTALVAPIKLGKGATVGAGSTLSKDVAEGSLTLTRGQLKKLADWKRPQQKPQR